MPKIKIAKKSPSLDMTPMVDLAFLLVTFFMLTTKFRPDEPVIVDQPSSVSQIPLPDKGVLMLTIDGKGRVFFNVEGQQIRRDILDRLGSHFNITFDEKEKKRFAVGVFYEILHVLQVGRIGAQLKFQALGIANMYHQLFENAHLTVGANRNQ